MNSPLKCTIKAPNKLPRFKMPPQFKIGHKRNFRAESAVNFVLSSVYSRNPCTVHTICQHYTIDKVQYISVFHETVEILSDIFSRSH